MARYLIHRDEPIYWGIGRLTVGVWLLYLSCLYLSGSGEFRLKIAMYPDMIVFLMFGAIHAYIAHQFNKIMYDTNRNIGTTTETLYIVADVFVYAAFYNIVLLPLCGIGIIEWALLAYMLFSTLVIAQNRDLIYRFFSPLSFLILGLCLFLLKVAVTTLFPQNIYREMINGNATARFLLFAMSVLVLVYYVKGLFDHAIQKTNQGRSLAVMAFMGRQAAKIGVVIFTAPFLIFAAGIILPLGVIGVILFIGKIEQDFWKFVSPVLEKLLTTDRQNIILSKSLMIFQIASCLLYLIYFFYNNILLQNHIKECLDENKDHTTVKQRISKFYPKEYAALILDDLNQISAKDKLDIATNLHEFHRKVEDVFQKSEFRELPRPNRDAFDSFWHKEIE